MRKVIYFIYKRKDLISMKKFKSFLALLLLGGLVATGCGGKDKTPSNSGGSQQNSGGSQSGDSSSGDGGQQGGEGGGGQQGGGGEGGGQQGGGEVPADSQFVNKKFVFDSVSYPQNATIETALNQNYQGAYAAFFQSGKFELISVVNTYTMALLGTFTVADDDSYARLDVLKEYDGESEAYDYITSGTCVTNIRYNEGLQKYVLPMRQEVEHNVINFDVYLTRSNEAPEPANLPDDPNGETFDPQYQVYKDVWDRLFVNRGLLHFSASNFKVTHDTTIFEIDNRGSNVSKFYEHWTTGSPNSGYYYERTSIVGNSYNYNFTIVAGGEVQPASPVEYGVDFFDSEVGLAPIPFNWMQYNSVGHYYFRNSYTYQNSFYGSRTVNNYRVYFGANYRVQQITYEDDAHQSFEFNFSNYNQVEINIPTAGGGSSIPSEDPAYYYQYIQNKVLTYDRVTNSDLTGEELEKAGQANANIVFGVFNDNSVQIEWPDTYFKDGDKISAHIVMYGSIEFTALTTLGTKQVVRATLSIANVVKDDVLQSITPFTTQAHWYIVDGQLRVKMFDDFEGDGSNYYVYLNPTNVVPTAIPLPSGGGGEDPAPAASYLTAKASFETWSGLTLPTINDLEADFYDDGDRCRFYTGVGATSDQLSVFVTHFNSTLSSWEHVGPTVINSNTTRHTYTSANSDEIVIDFYDYGGGDTYFVVTYIPHVATQPEVPCFWYNDGTGWKGESLVQDLYNDDQFCLEHFEITADTQFVLGVYESDWRYFENLNTAYSNGAEYVIEGDETEEDSGVHNFKVIETGTYNIYVKKGADAFEGKGVIFNVDLYAGYPLATIEGDMTGITDDCIDFVAPLGEYQYYGLEMGLDWGTLIITNKSSEKATALCADFESRLLTLGYHWKYEPTEFNNILVSPNRQVGIALAHAGNNVMVGILNLTLPENAGWYFYANYTFTTTNVGWADADAEFYAWIWGPSESGRWIQLNVAKDELDNPAFLYVDELPEDITGMKILRVNPNAEYEDKPEVDSNVYPSSFEEGVVWNETGDIDLTGYNSNIEFGFEGWVNP